MRRSHLLAHTRHCIEYAFEAPDTIPAGFSTLRLVNDADQLHMAHLVRLDAGSTVQELVEAYDAAIRLPAPGPRG